MQACLSLLFPIFDMWAGHVSGMGFLLAAVRSVSAATIVVWDCRNLQLVQLSAEESGRESQCNDVPT